MIYTSIALFEQKQIRKIWYNEQWFFSIIDVVAILSESQNPRRYRSDLKRKLSEQEGFRQLYENIVQLKLPSSDGKMYETDTANTVTILRIIQSIPSPQAEPFKQWLAVVGSERVQEIENPELAQERMKLIYEQKGYPKEWVDKRLRGIAVRQDLTDEWKERGVESDIDYAILTNEITQAAFGMTVKEYKALKGLEKHNLRDHMTDLELILTMLGEATTTKFHKDRDSKQFDNLKKDAHDGGDVAGKTRQDIESRGGKKIISDGNYLHLEQKKKQSYEKRIAFLPRDMKEFALRDEDTKADILEQNLDQEEIESIVSVNMRLTSPAN